MSWSRGFFRAWIVLSAVWIGLAVLMSKPETYALLWKAPKYEIEFGSGQKITLDTSMTHKALAGFLDNEVKQEAARSGKNVDATTREDILKSINSRYGTAGDQAWQAWLITLMPPIALLILGACIAWIFRGFRRAETAS